MVTWNLTQRVERIVIDGNGTFDGTTIDWLYDELGRLKEERYDSELGDGTEYDYIARYFFDLASNRVKLTKDNGNAVPASFSADETTTYEYDENDRLDTEVADKPGTNDDRHTVYSYVGTTQTVKEEHQGLTDQGTIRGRSTYAYNVQGRMESTRIETYDAAGTLVSDITTSYKYNDAGNRVEQTVNDGSGPVTTVYHIDPQNHTGYAQVLEEKKDLNGGGLNVADPGDINKTFTLGHDVIAQATAANTPQFFLYDGHGSTRALLDAAAAGANQRGQDSLIRSIQQ